MKGQLRIDQMFAFIVLDADGTEGVPAVGFGDGLILPLMGADMPRVDALRAIVRTHASLRGRKITLAKFSVREDVEVIDRTRENVG